MMKIVYACTLAFALCTQGFAADTKTTADLSKQEKEKMAEHHEKLAACLRSDKTVSACHEEMRETCLADKDACPGFGMGGKGRMHGMWRGKEAPAKN